MRKLASVEEAKALMNEAREWSVWRWLMEKRRVRETADRATEALGKLEVKLKELKSALEELKQAEEAAEASRLDAEATFDEAERRLSAAMAREGAQKAIASWELREKAIRKAESIGRKK